MEHLLKRLDEVSHLIYQMPFLSLNYHGKDIVTKALQADALDRIAGELLGLRLGGPL